MRVAAGGQLYSFRMSGSILPTVVRDSMTLMASFVGITMHVSVLVKAVC